MYQCQRCGLDCHYRSIIINHLNRKRPCEPKECDISNSSLLQELEDTADDMYASIVVSTLRTNSPSACIKGVARVQLLR
jgi:hypothetical protein